MTAQDRFADQWATVDQVADALKRLEEDAGALYETTILGQLKKMRAKDPAAFARLRAQVKDAKVLSMAEFDRLCLPDCRPFVMVGEPCTHAEALAHTQGIWPDAEIEP
ncbi:hypothetical protein [Pseudomonas aeruginosa]|uniref:hypothetical protein n=1 Tax=Pseudomonas aeruginosa TaxID=287 RepID=UPI0023412DEA|nr:hypothetical protein [Pseudomonas aeruginosa]